MFHPTPIFTLVIPCHNEKQEVVRQCLQSVNTQQFFNFGELETIIVIDGNKEKRRELQDIDKEYPNLHITLKFTEENKGAGEARNVGIDAAKGMYIIFADCDDVFFTNLAFANMYKAVTENHAYPDYLWGRFLEEAHCAPKQNRPPELVPHQDQAVWSFAKMYKKEFLDKHKIRFLAGARIYEDTYFCGMCLGLSPVSVFIDDILYFWRWHDNSTIRRNSTSNYYKHHKDILTMNTALIRDLQQAVSDFELSQEVINRVNGMVLNLIADTFVACYTMEAEAKQLNPAMLKTVVQHSDIWLDDAKEDFNPLHAQMALIRALPQKAQNGIVFEEDFFAWYHRRQKQSKS
jgi:glycosyltransferase involved in cell wall biosynthesis